MPEMVLGSGFLPIATEGDLKSTSVLHLPVNIGVFAHTPGRGTYALCDEKNRIFASKIKDYPLDYTLVQGPFNLHNIPTAGGGQVVGVYDAGRVNRSGLTLAMGVDLGAGFDASSLEKLASYTKNPALLQLLPLLRPAAGKIGMQAVAVYPSVQASLSGMLPLKPQQILDLTHAVWKKKTESFVKPGYWSVLHPALQEVVLRAYYSSNARGAEVSKAVGATAVASYAVAENRPDYAANFAAQCDCLLQALRSKGVVDNYAKSRKTSTLEGLKGYVEQLKVQISQTPGLRIRVEDRPVQAAELADPNSPTAQMLTATKRATKVWEAQGDPTKLAKAQQYQYDAKLNSGGGVAPTTPPPVAPASVNAESEFKKYQQPAQKRLNQLGFTDDKGRVLDEDGIWGSRSQEALRKFQTANRLPATGLLDAPTLQLLSQARPPAPATPEQAKPQAPVAAQGGGYGCFY